ncbi:cadherin-like domain-containing protein, partial [Pseudomonas sp. CrR25]|nr:cadherin-like domain-containing protein [Pseudomonas sp. CrR25]
KVSDSVYTLSVTPNANSTGDITVNVPAGAGSDAAGNASGAAQGEQGIDTAAPSVVISTSDSNLSTGEVTTLTFTFSEAVSNFTASDINATGGNIGNLLQSTSDPRVWTASFTQAGSASPSVSVAAGSYTDLAGNAGTAANLALNSTPIAIDDGFQLSGLNGQYFGYNEGPDGGNLTNVSQVQSFIGSHTASATFTATTLDYGVNNNGLGTGSNLQTFLGSDAASLSTDPSSTSDAILKLDGLIGMSAGTYQFRVTADDGYSIRIDGVVVAEYDGNQGPTARESNTFTIASSGQHQIEIIYWDQGGQAALKVELRPQNGTYSVLGGSSLTHEGTHLMGTEDQALTINPSTLLGNDSDRDGDALSIIAVQGATHGSVALVNGNVVFTPVGNYSGPATFTYTVSDGKGGTATATATINFKAVNDVPVAAADNLTTNEDTPATVDVLANDYDADGDGLTVTSASAAQGSVVINANGTLTYTPNANYSGSDSISYTV